MPPATLANPWLERRVLAYAHRGGALEGPSSTLAAMSASLAAGATALELDVHATADGQLVCCHDPTVDRTTNGHGAVAELTLAEVQALDNAWWFVPGAEVSVGRPENEYRWRGRAPADRAYAIPTLHEVLDAFPGVILNLDIKQTTPGVAPYEATLARVLEDHGRGDDVMVASFHDAALEAFSAVAPEIATSAGPLALARLWQALQTGEDLPRLPHKALQVPARLGDTTIVDRRTVAVAHELGLAVHVWTVDEPAEIERLVALDVDGVMSDRPSVLADTLARLGATWPGSTPET